MATHLGDKNIYYAYVHNLTKDELNDKLFELRNEIFAVCDKLKEKNIGDTIILTRHDEIKMER